MSSAESPARNLATREGFFEGGVTPPPKSTPQATPQGKYTASTPGGGGDDEDDERRIQQRQKQIQYGYNTDGYKNMERLLSAYPHLRNGGVLPLNPPTTTLKTSKRTWDVLIRKWRRALHMFDHVFIDEEDTDTTLEEVVAAQRQKWISPEHLGNSDKLHRMKRSAQDILALRDSPNVPKKLPVEENMLLILKSLDFYEPVANVIPEASPAHRGGGVSPQSAGIKIFIAPGNRSDFRNSSPVRERDTPTTQAQRRGGSPRGSGTSPTRLRGAQREDAAQCETPSTKLEFRFNKVATTPPPTYNQSLHSTSSNPQVK